METTALPQSDGAEGTSITPMPFFKKPSNYIKITLVVAAVLLAGAAVFAYFQGIGTIGTALIGAGSLVALTSCIIFHFVHNFLHQRQLSNSLLDQVSKFESSNNNKAIASGAKVNAMDADGNTPLHRAADKGDLALCQTLVSAGAKIDAFNEQDHIRYIRYPIDMAIENDHLPVVQFLFEKLSKNNSQNWSEQDWIAHILYKAALHNAENVFIEFMQSNDGRPALTESQLKNVLNTVIVECCRGCSDFNFTYNKNALPISLRFMALLKDQNAQTGVCALQHLQNEIAKETDTEVKERLQKVETALTS